ncbi:MAG: type III-B CRISPR module-associated protein Cmr5 [Deltaproteobacteria bacterium]|nr:type III-B CRISPR module-associated protein Cmr5 [Deltaproteobacteria bacterium]
MQQTLEQKRASSAWNEVEKINRASKDIKDKYKGLVLKLPALIHTNGLGQTLAFLKYKGKGDTKDPHEIVYNHLQGWLFNNLKWDDIKDSDLIKRIIFANSEKYRYATNETLAYLTWLRRFAEAVLPEPKNEVSKNG